jgi:tetratricopeptide (TPR) repeat protein
VRNGTRALLVLSIVAATACARHKPVVVAGGLLRDAADRHASDSRYVVRMTDGQREWQVEFPDAVYGSEVRVPLSPGGRVATRAERIGLTAADRELQSARDPDPVPEAPRAGAAAPPASSRSAPEKSGKSGKSDKSKASYLLSIARIRDLFDARNFEVALVQLVDLEHDYPNDEKLLEMKGSIYRKMGKPRFAREAWERVLAMDPDNRMVADALRELEDENERAADSER